MPCIHEVGYCCRELSRVTWLELCIEERLYARHQLGVNLDGRKHSGLVHRQKALERLPQPRERIDVSREQTRSKWNARACQQWKIGLRECRLAQERA